MKPKKKTGFRTVAAKEELQSYPRFYEAVFSRTIKDPTWFRALERLRKDMGKDNVETANELLKIISKDAGDSFWNIAVKNAWIESKFFSNLSTSRRETIYDLLENETPFCFRAVRGFNHLEGSLRGAVPKIIDDFHAGNPFLDFTPYFFPYRRISPFFLFPVARLDEEKIKFLLSYADQRSFTLAKYLDFVANFILCFNQDKPRDFYELVNYPEHGMFIVREVKYE